MPFGHFPLAFFTPNSTSWPVASRAFCRGVVAAHK
jgi:hypothetical protein